MIVGLGIDLVQISRMQSWLNNESKKNRLFGVNEQKIIEAAGVGQFEKAASRFAAKEAFVKALGCGLAGLKLSEIEVLNRESGQPYYQLSGEAKKRFETVGGRLSLSLSHEKEYAIAVAIIEK